MRHACVSRRVRACLTSDAPAIASTHNRPRAIRVILADDSFLVLQGLGWCSRTLTASKVAAECADPEAVIDEIQLQPPDVVPPRRHQT